MPRGGGERHPAAFGSGRAEPGAQRETAGGPAGPPADRGVRRVAYSLEPGPGPGPKPRPRNSSAMKCQSSISSFIRSR